MISVFGLGFVGLTTALGFSNYGLKVYGIDVNEERKELIRNGKLPFLEKGLDKALLEQNNKNFFVTDDIEMAVKDSEVIFYCVGTPYGENGEANLNYLFSAIKQTLVNYKKEDKKILVIKSTIPPSTTKEKVIPFINKLGFEVGKNLIVANNPEFLREGHCWEDFIEADRVVIGCDCGDNIDKLEEIYKPFDVPIYKVSHNTGEYIKYLSNTLLATLISYSNEMSEIAENIGDIQISKAFNILHMDKRWDGSDIVNYIYPGCGYGGYCLPKDTNALYALARDRNVSAEILGNVIKTNDNMSKVIAARISKKVDKKLKIGILGLSFKPNSDDVRDCASARVIKELLNMGYKNILGYDPVAQKEFEKHYNLDITYCDELKKIEKESDVLVILTAWDEFKYIKDLSDKMILDYRYM